MVRIEQVTPKELKNLLTFIVLQTERSYGAMKNNYY